MARFLNRDDLTTDIPNFIQEAEAMLRIEVRARLLVDMSPFAVVAGDEQSLLPSDFGSMNEVTHIGPNYYGPIDTIPLHEIGEYLRRARTGNPCVAAVISDGSSNRLKWAPVPDAALSLQLSYWAKLSPLSTTKPQNRWLTEYPHLYRLAALVIASPFLREDERVSMWAQQYENALDKIDEDIENRLFGGTLSRVPGRTF